MFKDAFKSLFGRPAPDRSPSGTTSAPPPPAPRAARPLPEPSVRNSLALEQFFSNLEGQDGLRILDLSGASQANINFVLQYGHHLYCEDLMATVNDIFGDDASEDFYTRQADEDLVERFLSQTFASLQGPFDGALIWDTMQFLQPPLLDHAIGHLHRLLEPNAYVFAFFHADEKRRWIPVSSYRIESAKTMRVIPRSWKPANHIFTNRMLERTFADFQSTKFFLTRDHVRELIVRR